MQIKKPLEKMWKQTKILALEKNYSSGISKSVALKEGIDPIAPSATKADIFSKEL